LSWFSKEFPELSRRPFACAIVVQGPLAIPLQLAAATSSRSNPPSYELRYDCWSLNGLATIARKCRAQKLLRKRNEWLDLPVSILSILIRS
jgi:hypothetical protein